MEPEETTTPETEATEPRYRATLYSTWMQVPDKGPVKYFVVIKVLIQGGIVKEYELLRLFEPELATIEAHTFCKLVDDKKLREWKQ